MLEDNKKTTVKKVKKVKKITPSAPKVAKKAVTKKPSKEDLKKEWTKAHNSLKEAKRCGDKSEIKKWNELLRNLSDELSKL